MTWLTRAKIPGDVVTVGKEKKEGTKKVCRIDENRPEKNLQKYVLKHIKKSTINE